jgi:hypothetical protein
MSEEALTDAVTVLNSTRWTPPFSVPITHSDPPFFLS